MGQRAAEAGGGGLGVQPTLFFWWGHFCRIINIFLLFYHGQLIRN